MNAISPVRPLANRAIMHAPCTGAACDAPFGAIISPRQLAKATGPEVAPHYGAADPTAYRNALIHLTARAKLAKEALGTAKGGGDDDRIRLARQDLIKAYLDLYELRGAVGDVKATYWKAAGFDVAEAWQTYGMPLPPLADLRQEMTIPPLHGGGKLFFSLGTALAGVFAAVAFVGIARFGPLRVVPVLVAAAELIVANKYVALGASAAVGFIAGFPLVTVANRLLGYREPPKSLDL